MIHRMSGRHLEAISYSDGMYASVDQQFRLF
jgi:hypothetical protein